MPSHLPSIPEWQGWAILVVLCVVVAAAASRVATFVLSPAGGRLASSGRRPRTVLAVLVLVVSGATLAVAGLADGARERDDLSAYDPAIHTAVVAERTPLLTELGRSATFLASQNVLVVLTVVVVAALVWRRHRRAAAVVAATMVGSAALTLGLKLLVGRTRPATADLIGPIDTGYSFPSGHTLNATVFFGLLAGLAMARVRSRSGRFAVALAWVLACASVAGSRIYLGYHWLTDVLAGWGVGVAVLAVACAAYVTWRNRRQRLAAAPRGPGRGPSDGHDRVSTAP